MTRKQKSTMQNTVSADTDPRVWLAYWHERLCAMREADRALYKAGQLSRRTREKRWVAHTAAVNEVEALFGECLLDRPGPRVHRHYFS